MDFCGRTLWNTRFGTEANDIGVGVAVGPTGDIFATGYTFGDLITGGQGTNYDAFLVKLDNAGNGSGFTTVPVVPVAPPELSPDQLIVGEWKMYQSLFDEKPAAVTTDERLRFDVDGEHTAEVTRDYLTINRGDKPDSVEMYCRVPRN